MTNNQDNNLKYQRLVNGSPGHPTVIVQQPVAAVGPNFVYSQYAEKIRKFNRGLIMNSILAIMISWLTLLFYGERNCLWDYVIHQPTPDHPIRISDLKNSSQNIMGLAVIMLIVGLLKSASGYGKSSGCYLFIVAILSFIGLATACAMAYLSAYSPCVVSFNEIASKAAKDTIAGFASLFNEKMPVPDRGFFGETTVFKYYKDDKYGVAIFIMNTYLAINYLSMFIGAICF